SPAVAPRSRQDRRRSRRPRRPQAPRRWPVWLIPCRALDDHGDPPRFPAWRSARENRSRADRQSGRNDMQRLTIARFDPVRTANIVAALYAVIVLVFGALLAIPFGFAALVAGERAGGSGLATGGAVGVLVLLLIGVVFYAAIGWVITAITCVLYNWL